MGPVSGWVSGWRLALRLAAREAWHAPGRSLLVLVMVTLPVVAVVAADVAQASASVSSVEGLDRRIGSSQALVTAMSGTGRIYQEPDPAGAGYLSSGRGHRPVATWPEVDRTLGGHRPSVEVRLGRAGVSTDLGVLDVDVTALDLGAPLSRGLFRLTAGRLPRASGEVLVNRALAGRGFAVGDRLVLADGRRVTVVGTAESTAERTAPLLFGRTDLVPPGRGVRQWLVGGGPVTWDDVLALNRLGATVVSRQVIEHPPGAGELPPRVRELMSTSRTQLYTVLALIGVMALLEVVLLAGPAFAVGARRQSRNLALLAANGGTPRQSRRVVLASAVVLGSVGALAGTVLGLAAGRAVLPFLQARSDTWFGPFQVRWTHVLVVAAFGLLSALLAAVVPAWVASRQDVVAVLAGRRGDRGAGRRSPFVGLLLLGAGVALAALGARRSSGELVIAAAAVVSVFGMIFLVPVVVVAVARWGRRLPLPLRYAVRDAARHRTRTTPAVAAVAATVAGVVTLSIGTASNQASARAHYQPLLPQGLASVSVFGAHPDWPAVRAAVAATAPTARVETVRGLGRAPAFDLRLPRPQAIPAAWSTPFATPVLVADGVGGAARALLAPSLTSAQRDRVWRALAAGRAVVFTRRPTSGTDVVVVLGRGRRPRVPATFVAVGNRPMPSEAVVPAALVSRLGVPADVAGLALSGPTLTRSQEGDLRQVLTGIDASSSLYVERGYQTPSSERVVLWILFGLAAVLMLGGTLTATFLALSDARPDLATLSAVGASPRTRRGVAAAYAVSVGVVGALLGAAVGFIPGVAVSYPLTRRYGEPGPSHYLAVPWLEILGLVVALPVVTALVVGLVARSRLPLVARLD